MNAAGILLLAGLVPPAFFMPVRADTWVGVGVDVIHEQYRPSVIVHHAPIVFMAWERNASIGATKEWGDTWRFGLGGTWLVHTEPKAGTHENFLVTLRYCGRHYCGGLYHVSHGSGRLIGYKPDKPNAGLNWLAWQFLW